MIWRENHVGLCLFGESALKNGHEDEHACSPQAGLVPPSKFFFEILVAPYLQPFEEENRADHATPLFKILP